MNADQLLAIYASRIQEPPPRGLGRETTTTSQLTEYGQRLFGTTDFFRGVYPADQGPKQTTGHLRDELRAAGSKTVAESRPPSTSSASSIAGGAAAGAYRA